MFHQPRDPRSPSVPFTFEGQACEATAGQTVAAALMGAGHLTLRESIVSGSPRAAYCMMGVCFECLVEIDGHPNQQACMVLIREGMQIKRQSRPLGE